MDTEELTMEEKCENLMCVVVETRKRFGKLCVDYDQKTSLMENKILNLQLETISNFRSKSKNTVASLNVEDMCKDADDFIAEILERKKRIDNLRKTIKDTQEVVLQLKEDSLGKKVHQQLTAEAMLSHARQRKRQEIDMKQE